MVSCLLFEFTFGSSLKELKNVTNKKIFHESNLLLPTRIQHNTLLEVIWTLIPCIILFIMAIPSFSLLYVIEDLDIIEYSLKVIGNQWYWTYEFPTQYYEKKFDSVMVLESDLLEGSLRLLEVDHRLILPIEKQLRLFITATDVLHSFALPSMGIKTDACPGRLNQIALFIKRRGIYYGQCSEICGINHSFMPIVIEAVDDHTFFQWLVPSDKLINYQLSKK
jgi:heme/copper-type cytochrome/quinol oxidase subunit 2